MSEMFLTWFRRQSLRNDAIGDLARDYIHDKNNDLITGYRSFDFYLHCTGACDGAIGALHRAYREYQYSKLPVKQLKSSVIRR